jgi:hypothetical protein
MVVQGGEPFSLCCAAIVDGQQGGNKVGGRATLRGAESVAHR